MAYIADGRSQVRRGRTRLGWALSGLVILFLLMDGTIKLVPIQAVVETMRDLGWRTDPWLMRLLGVLTLAGTLLYAIPRTAVLGALLLTAYLGGAVATQVRVGNPLFSHILFGVYLGLMMWGGLYLRDPRLRTLLRALSKGEDI
jgi:hypothetical protein